MINYKKNKNISEPYLYLYNSRLRYEASLHLKKHPKFIPSITQVQASFILTGTMIENKIPLLGALDLITKQPGKIQRSKINVSGSKTNERLKLFATMRRNVKFNFLKRLFAITSPEDIFFDKHSYRFNNGIIYLVFNQAYLFHELKDIYPYGFIPPLYVEIHTTAQTLEEARDLLFYYQIGG